MNEHQVKMGALQAENDRLYRENLYLRKLLNIHIDEKLTIPDENKKTNVLKNDVLSTDEKIKLYRSLFRGREDVYATRWENKDGRSGYSPKCANEWDRGVCRKPQIKCSECQYSQWLPITNQVIYNHLIGKDFVGIYPLTLDESSYFLAIDFDKENWREDAISFIKTCRACSIPAVLERSQSGNGGHVWIFFAEPISASLVRSLGTALLTQTMRLCKTIHMRSYDRLFPNQDTLPRGGLGNLIALPLQGSRRKNGNSIFLNDELQPYSDPWEPLLTIRPMSQQDLLSALKSLGKQGELLDVRISQVDEEKPDPWVSSELSPKYPIIHDSLPSQIEIVLANLIYIPLPSLPAIFINLIKKLAAFQNPEFYQAQAMRLSIYGKPRIIACAEEFAQHIGIPRGCENELLKLFNHYNVNITVIDKTENGKEIKIDFLATLRLEQKKAYETLLSYRYGILAATTAFGKTVIAAKIIAERKVNTLVLVHRQQLLEQWQERLSSLFGLAPKAIGTLGGGRNKLTGTIDVAMLQSLSKKGNVKDEVTQYGQVIVDECHHLSAFSFEKILKKVRARYVLGLTATPIRKDGHHPIIIMQCGPIRYRFSSKNQIAASQINHRVCPRNTTFCFNSMEKKLRMSDIYKALVTNEERNEQIFNDVLLALEAGRTPLLLTERTHHLRLLANRLCNFVKHIFVLQGGMKKSEREDILRKLKELPNDAERLILATGRYIGEGFDDPILDTLFLTLPISWHGTLQQYVGRLHRPHQNKNDILVYDYADVQVPLLYKMYQKRLKKYLAMGYCIDEK
jgi:superfamily II DNA or RNA helicase